MSETVGTPSPKDESIKVAPLSPTTQAVLNFNQAMLPALIAICGGLWVVYAFVQNQHESELLRSIQAKKDNQTRLVEARRGFSDAQLKLYLETAQIVGKLVSWTKTTDGDWEASFRRFEQLFWTELSMVEDEGVKTAMQRFATKARDINPRRLSDLRPGEFEELKQLSFALALALKTSLENSWNINLTDKDQGR